MSAHGSPLRGLMSTPRSQTFEGRFGRMFRALHPAAYGRTDADTEANLKALGTAMEAPHDNPFDGADPEESAIPSLYTYLGQFIDHDLTFGPEGSFQKQRDPDALVDFRTPAFDLDCVYGRGPGDQPYLYDGDRFLLGNPIGGGGDPNAADLPRNNANPARALIGDPRNDENSIVSQLQGLFLRFHNRVIADNPGIAFEAAQQQVQRHYQYVILNDFLPRVVNASVLAGLKTNGHFDQHKLQYYHPKHTPFMPLEFSTAGYRFGHSMIRPGYRLNDNGAKPLAIFAATEAEDLRGKHAMDPARGIDWGRFVDGGRPYDGADGSTDQKRRLQFAYKIDTSLVNPLASLPPNVATGIISLAQRNLLRSYSLGLPSGQAIAKAMHVRVLHDDEIQIGKAADGETTKPIVSISPVFAHNCPLWTYVLAEAMAHRADMPITATGGPATIATPQLGPVGGRMVAEVFLGIMFGDSSSLLRSDPAWTPAIGAGYTLRDFVAYATGRPVAMAAGSN